MQCWQVILRRVIRPQLVTPVSAVVVVGTLGVGFPFNPLGVGKEDQSPRARLLQSSSARSERAGAGRMGSAEAEIVDVTGHGRIARPGILRTLGLIIDGKVVGAGRIPPGPAR